MQASVLVALTVLSLVGTGAVAATTMAAPAHSAYGGVQVDAKVASDVERLEPPLVKPSSQKPPPRPDDPAAPKR